MAGTEVKVEGIEEIIAQRPVRIALTGGRQNVTEPPVGVGGVHAGEHDGVHDRAIVIRVVRELAFVALLSGKEGEQRRLAAAVAAHQGMELAVVDIEVESFEDLLAAEGLGEMACGDHE